MGVRKKIRSKPSEKLEMTNKHQVISSIARDIDAQNRLSAKYADKKNFNTVQRFFLWIVYKLG